MTDNKISMPSGMAGLTRFNEEYESRFVVSPMRVFLGIGLIIILLLILLANEGSLGYKLLGMA